MKILKNLAIGLGTLGLMMSVTSCGNTDTPASDSAYSESDHSHNHDHSNSDSSGSTSESGSSTTGGSSSTTTPTTPTVHTHTWGGVRYEFTSVNGNYSITARRDCTTCDEHEEEAVSAVKNIIKEPTCTETGSAIVVSDDFTNSSFTVQTKTVTLDALGHNKVHHEEVDATCDNDGHSEYDECLRCGEITGYTKYEKLGHDYQISYTWSDDLTTVTATRVCLNDETDIVSEVGRAVVQTIKQATCQETGLATSTASFINSFFETQRRENAVVPKTEHNLKIISGYDATCTEDGLTDKIYCLDCGEVIQEATDIFAEGHKYEWVGAVEPTCQNDGSTGEYKCTVCGKVMCEASTIEKTEHAFSYIRHTATCKEDGYWIMTCQTCGYEEVDESTVAYASAAYHKEVIVPAKEPTSCLESGKGYYEWSYCSVCGEELIAKVEREGFHKYEPTGFKCIYCGHERDYNSYGEINPNNTTLYKYVSYSFIESEANQYTYPTVINGMQNVVTKRKSDYTNRYFYTSSIEDEDYAAASVLAKLALYQDLRYYPGLNKFTITYTGYTATDFVLDDEGDIIGEIKLAMFNNVDTAIGTNSSSFKDGQFARIKFHLSDGSVVEMNFSVDKEYELEFSIEDVVSIDATVATLIYGYNSDVNKWVDVEYKDLTLYTTPVDHIRDENHAYGADAWCYGDLTIVKNEDYVNYYRATHYYECDSNYNITTNYYLSVDEFVFTEEEIQNSTINLCYMSDAYRYEITIPDDFTAGTYKIKIDLINNEVTFVPVTE